VIAYIYSTVKPQCNVSLYSGNFFVTAIIFGVYNKSEEYSIWISHSRSSESCFVFPRVFIVEEVDGLGDMGSVDTTAVFIQIVLDVLLHMSLISDSLMKLFSGKKQNFCSLDFCPYVPNFQDL